MTAVLDPPQQLGTGRARAKALRPGATSSRPDTARTSGHRSLGPVLALIVAFGSAQRLWHLGSSRFSYDEAFTAMAGRLPLGGLTDFITHHDSHPPLDYLIHAPFARAGTSEFWFRFPSVVMSIAALALLAWWLRSRRGVAVWATVVMAIDPFQISHGRDARMYAELEFIGVAVAALTSAWLTRPRTRHAVLLGLLVFFGLLTHVSMFLLAVGLMTVPGLRRDRAAWQWRSAIASGGLGWALVWGTHFVIQAQGGHSSWIPSTTPATLATAVAHLLTLESALVLPAIAAIVAGGVLIVRADRRLARVWFDCFLIPVSIAAVAGLVAPVVLDRTFTLMAWGPVVALAFVLDAVMRRNRFLGALAVAAVLVMALPSAWTIVTRSKGPDAPLRALEARARPGDIVAVQPLSKAPELQWSLGVQTHSSTRQVSVPGHPRAFGIRMGTGASTGRIWLLNWHAHRTSANPIPACGPRWGWGHVRIHCLMADTFADQLSGTSTPSTALTIRAASRAGGLARR